MVTAQRITVLALSLPVLLAGCTGSSKDQPRAADTNKQTPSQPADQPGGEAEFQEALSKLDSEDRRLAEEQQFCAVMNDHRLGSMGTPVKVQVGDQPIFLCCKSCQKKALTEPDKTLARFKELRTKTADTPAK